MRFNVSEKYDTIFGSVTVETRDASEEEAARSLSLGASPRKAALPGRAPAQLGEGKRDADEAEDTEDDEFIHLTKVSGDGVRAAKSVWMIDAPHTTYELELLVDGLVMRGLVGIEPTLAHLDDDSEEEAHFALVEIARAYVGVRLPVLIGDRRFGVENEVKQLTPSAMHVEHRVQHLERELPRLIAREKELLDRCSRLLDERRENSRRYQVMAFHKKYGHPVRTAPATDVSEDEVRFRMKLDMEETFEMLEAVFDLENPFTGGLLQCVRDALHELRNMGKIRVDLVGFIDALGDRDYVVEGHRLVFGVNGEPIARMIHASNMAKIANGPDGKPVKPEGWEPPDIAGELERQRQEAE